MKLSVDFGRWTAMKAALAVAGTLAIAGAVGSALAVSPTLQVPIKWQGGWEASPTLAIEHNDIYTVPSGRNLMITDLIVTNPGASARSFILMSWSPPFSCFNNSTQRSNLISVPPLGSTTISLQTGIGFIGGSRVCVFATDTLHLTARGFLFSPAPAS